MWIPALVSATVPGPAPAPAPVEGREPARELPAHPAPPPAEPAPDRPPPPPPTGPVPGEEHWNALLAAAGLAVRVRLFRPPAGIPSGPAGWSARFPVPPGPSSRDVVA